ncbi:hypothetical protein [Kitasatospora sp. NPDC098663]|uniref:hypothetical protein n=1 Tax=Kitasatospora sp. NPDC098663 TaxID=3364096 RepID=UPI00381CF378
MRREADRGIVRTVVTYRVERDGAVLCEASEGFDMWPADPALLLSELEEAGLQPVQAPRTDLIAAHRPGL